MTPIAHLSRWKRTSALIAVLSATMIFSTSYRFNAPQAAVPSVVDLKMNKAIPSMSTGVQQEVLETGTSAQKRNLAIPVGTARREMLSSYSLVPASSDFYGSAERCLAQAIYYEAALEPELGQRAVAQVVLNRVRHPAYPNTVCGVVYQGWNQRVCQFSFTCDGSLARTPSASHWRRAKQFAAEALAGHQVAEVGTATHYHADYVVPRWAYTLSKIETLGRHIFYRFPGVGGSARSFAARWGGREAIPQVNLQRFTGGLEDIGSGEFLPVDTVPGLTVTSDVTDRHDPKDVGGRLDTAKTWRLSIPDPRELSAGYRATLEAHEKPPAAVPSQPQPEEIQR